MKQLITLLVVVAAAAAIFCFHDTGPECIVCARLRYGLCSFRLLRGHIDRHRIEPSAWFECARQPDRRG